MATPRRSARSQNPALSYKEPDVPEIHSDSDSDLEPTATDNVKSRSSKKGSARKVREDGPSSSTKKKTPSRPTRLSEADSLYDIIRNQNNVIPMATVQWWEEEAVNQEQALCKLVNMMLQASGCIDVVPKTTFAEDRDVDEEVRKIEAGQTVKSQLAAKDKLGKKLKTHMSEFWRKFILNASDENILSINDHPILRWLFALSTSQLKDIRFTACFAAVEMLISLLDRANDVLDGINKLDRLVQAGGSGKARNKEQLQGRHQLKIAIESFMDQLFNSVFVHRHRDVDADIRARCIMCLGECIAKYKTKFFDNSYLKYLGWSLNDKEHVVRLASVEALAVLFEKHQVTELEMFTNRFRDRLVELRMDVNNEVASSAMRLLTTLARHKLLNQEHNELIYKMLIEDANSVRSSAAAFTEAAYLDGVLTPLFEEEASKNKSLNKGEMLVKGLIEMVTSVIGAEIGDEAVYQMVEALLPHVPILQDWSLVCKILMEDDEEGEDSLAAEDKAMLSKFLVATLRIAGEDPAVEARAKGKGKKASAGVYAEGSMYISTVFASMLKRFSADLPTLKALVQIPVYIDLHALTDRQSKSFKEAVDLLVDIAMKAQDSELLTSCATSLQHLMDGEYPLQASFVASIDVFLDSVRSDFKKALDALHKNPRATATQTLRIKRTLILASNLDLFLEHNDLFEMLVKVINLVSTEMEFSSLTGRYLVTMAAQAIFWKSLALFEAQDSENSSVSTRDVIKARDSVIESLIAVASSNLDIEIRLQAAIAISEISQVFGKRQDSRQWSDSTAKQLDFDQHNEAMQAIEMVVCPIISGSIAISDSMKETLSLDSLHFDQEDPTGLNKAAALALVKIVLYNNPTGEMAANVLATILLHVPYNVEFNRQLHQILSRKIEDWRTWLLCHQKMYERILLKAQAKEDVSDLTSCMIDAAGSAPLHPSAVQTYLLEAFKWALQGMPRSLGFLDVASLHIKSLSTAQARTLIDNISDLCSKKRINLASKEASVQNIVTFHNKVQELLKGPGRADSYLKSPEPSKRSRSAKAADGDDPSSPQSGILQTPMSSLAGLDREISEPGFLSEEEDTPTQASSKSGQKKGGKGNVSSRKTSGKGKLKRNLDDEADEEGFVSVKRAR